MSITWVRNGDGKYLVEDREHLLQIMHKGTLYNDLGNPPTDYWASSSSYLQTVDIDLAEKHADIVPIGIDGDSFTGEYDGGLFQIRNWSYAGREYYSGLFGYAQSATLKDIRLSGVWTVAGDSRTGFLAGYLNSSTVYNIEGDFAEGTVFQIETGDTSQGAGGVLVGDVGGGTATALTLKGVIDWHTPTFYAGGVIGQIRSAANVSHCRNLATFPNGIKGDYAAGGIMGVLHNGGTLSKCLNAMKGDVVGGSPTISGMSGGIVGFCLYDLSLEFVVNSMEGNITSGALSGGIMGALTTTTNDYIACTGLLNYMKGDVEASEAGGIVGSIGGSAGANGSITKSVVAMQGTVDQSVRGDMTAVLQSLEVTVDASFGMSYTSNDDGSATMVVDSALLYHQDFTDLPYVDMSGTDGEGNVYNWDFVYGNVGGKAAYDKYTHLSVGKGEVSAPFYTDFGLAESNSVVYLTYANYAEKAVYIDSTLGVIETTASLVFWEGTSALVSVAWTKNYDGQYLVQTKQHLLQLMNRGTLYTDAGTPPTDYWASSYLQTSDIDLANDHASIVPIGISGVEMFTGEYDGGLFQIRNWSYSGSGGETYTGLFGYCYPATLKHVRLSGVWTLSAGSSGGGFLAGYMYESTVYDVEGNFDAGTRIGGFTNNTGGLFGQVSSRCLCTSVTLRGTLEFENDVSTYLGGVFGYCGYATVEQCRNLASFPEGIRSTGETGGLMGRCVSPVAFSKCLNAMQGDITGLHVGGIAGSLYYGRYEYSTIVNSMVGNITSTGTAGGIFGFMNVHDNGLSDCTKLLNYMKGDIVGSTGSGGITASIDFISASGDASQYGDIKITKSVVAMQGAVGHSVRASENFTPSIVEVSVDTSFGMTYTGNNDYGSATMVADTALVYAPGFTDLPYIDMSGTDAEGNVYNWDFVYGNVGGKAAYDKYTHLSVGKGEVSAPFYTDFGLAESNSVVYLTYANYDEKAVYIDSTITVIETTAALVFDKATSAFIGLSWTKNYDAKYLVQTKQHLLQLMTEGSLYTSAGTPPTDYWASAYLQTSDIDLANDHASIVPIGKDTAKFSGEYDGSNFQIGNWSHTGDTDYVGLFGYCEGATLQHIRLSGIWYLSSEEHSGFLAGFASSSTMYDIEGDFSVGTELIGGSASRKAAGVLFGSVQGSSTVYGATVHGTVEINSGHYRGGVIGFLSIGSSVTQCRNLGTFPNGISGAYVGGIFAYVTRATVSSCLNGMNGDLVGSIEVGGIAGRFSNASTAENVVNSMTGNISGASAGGIVGFTYNYDTGWVSGSKLLNYMRGDILGTRAGGIVGYIYRTSTNPNADCSIAKSVVAMQGNVEGAVRGRETFVPSQMEVTVDTSFGMHFDQNQYGVATMVVDDALVYHPGFTDLPYFVLDGTDPTGTTYDWDFVYANLEGKYEQYTHLSVHTSLSISTPLPTTVGSLAADTAYLAYSHVTEKAMYIDSTLNIVETEADVVFDLAKSEVVYGTPTPAETIIWTKDADGKFEVQTKEHLLQLMQKGALYTDLGERPTNALSYWTHHYVQTAEIDFAGDDLANVVRIGDKTTTFLGSYEENGFEVLNWRGPDVGDDESLFGAYTTLEWTMNAEGQHEVATAEHLVQIMQRGLLYFDEGDFPTDHWSASYIQTADIDLSACHAKILPIGNAVTSFTGQYDGGHFKISNWSFEQPTDSASVTSTGLFGAVTNAEIKRLHLSGVWILMGSDHASAYLGDGFLCGSAIGSTVYDVTLDLDAPSLMSGGPTTTAPATHRVGLVAGYVTDSVVCGATVRGTIDVKNYVADGHSVHVGGVVGYAVNAGSNISLCRNLASFPNGITGFQSAGGIVGYLSMGTLEYCVNAMQGDLEGGTYAGGVCGAHVAGGHCSVLNNAMTGNVEATINAGGIFGCIDASGVDTIVSAQLMNYMCGNVSAASAGGVVGLVTRSGETPDADVSITNSIVAMHGSVIQSIRGAETFAPSALDVVVNKDFGMVCNSDYASSSAAVPTGFTTHPAFADLPYVVLSGTDPDGFSVNFDFVFANLGGHSVYKDVWTHLSLHTAEVSAPLRTDYGLNGATNTTVYLTYSNLDSKSIFVDDALTSAIVETEAEVAYNHDKTAVLLGTATLPLICAPRALTIQANIDLNLGLNAHITHQATSANAREIVTDVEILAGSSTKVIQGLEPDTLYMVRLYSDDALIEKVLVTTSPNTTENYIATDFYVTEEESYDISEVGDKVSASIINEIFATGDVVEVDMDFARKTTMETTFVKKGELVEIDRLEAVLLPFDPSATETQQSTIKLSDNTSVTVSLAQGSTDISVGGKTYPSGRSFILDGKKCTVFDI